MIKALARTTILIQAVCIIDKQYHVFTATVSKDRNSNDYVAKLIHVNDTC